MQRHIFFFVILLSFYSCKKEYEVIEHYVIDVVGPEKGKTGEKIIFQVTAYGGDCDAIDEFKDSKEGFEIVISTYIRSWNGMCTQSFSEFSKNYYFKERKAGTFTLKFKSYDGYIERKITID